MEVSVLEQNKPTNTAQMLDESGTMFALHYHLQSYTSSTGKVLFGIKADMLNGAHEVVKSAETYAITENYGEIKALLTHLSKHAISPYALNCMVEEWFSAAT